MSSRPASFSSVSRRSTAPMRRGWKSVSWRGGGREVGLGAGEQAHGVLTLVGEPGLHAWIGDHEVDEPRRDLYDPLSALRFGGLIARGDVAFGERPDDLVEQSI